MNRAEPLFPRFEGQLLRGKPTDMDLMPLSAEDRRLLETQALDIFTSCSNAGIPLREVLAAILLTGMNWGVCVAKERADQ